MLSNSRMAVPLFLVLGFALSWYPWALHALGYSGNPNPNPLGLLVAALIAAAVGGGWRESVSILKAIIRVRVSATVWLATFAIPVGALAVGISIAALCGVTVRPMPIAGSELLERFLFAFLFVALGEEPGWRGFLQPMLQRRLGVLGATSCVAVVWAVWHAPLLGAEFAWEIVPPFLLSVVAAAFVLAWVFNSAGGSVLLPMLMHATVNTLGAGLVFRWVAEDQLAFFWYIYAAVWMAIAYAVTAFGARWYRVANADELFGSNVN
jgi:membrane protease YdiL (CAAX protease family)